MSTAAPHDVVNEVADGKLLFRCPGCHRTHAVRPRSAGGGWEWNGSRDRPTFSPSVLAVWAEGEEREHRQCHSFVTDGQIQFLADCTHPLAGQTVPLPVWGAGA